MTRWTRILSILILLGVLTMNLMLLQYCRQKLAMTDDFLVEMRVYLETRELAWQEATGRIEGLQSQMEKNEREILEHLKQDERFRRADSSSWRPPLSRVTPYR